jgi:hypothetical protein
MEHHPRYPLLEMHYDATHRGKKPEERLEVCDLEVLIVIFSGHYLSCGVINLGFGICICNFRYLI